MSCCHTLRHPTCTLLVSLIAESLLTSLHVSIVRIAARLMGMHAHEKWLWSGTLIMHIRWV